MLQNIVRNKTNLNFIKSFKKTNATKMKVFNIKYTFPFPPIQYWMLELYINSDQKLIPTLLDMIKNTFYKNI